MVNQEKLFGIYIVTTFAACVLFLTGCSRPEQKDFGICRAKAVSQTRGVGFTASDTAELIEACMLSKGFLLRETGKRCPDGFQGATNRLCYYPNTAAGRLFDRLRGN
jgi:hypothetical protein